ncbi:MFS transporter [Streptomyces sp. NBC_00893]|uniref:MFS transporter n=1 Tax=Streptomyces sp. NBC_00893 TaxID=2975862 RepID=UPI002253832D|nr:MFS transporter [Streptomyces sp. NBC_00893]MCX4850318.1 MFS transporter [Streptomyces sp. NBC_00893]
MSAKSTESPLASAGALVAIPALAAAGAIIVGGRISDRLGGHHRKVIVPSMTAAAAALLLMAFSTSITGFVVFGTLASVAVSLCYMPILAVPMGGLAAEDVGVGSAVIVFGGQVADTAAPPVIGALADAFSFKVAFASLVLGAAIAAVMALLTPQDAASVRTATGVSDLPTPAKDHS